MNHWRILLLLAMLALALSACTASPFRAEFEFGHFSHYDRD